MFENKYSWRELITEEMEDNKDSWDSLVSITLTDNELDFKFDTGFGGTEGLPFTAWTKNFVYFPCCYDGAEWCGSAPRNPNGASLSHQGGG